ncbi:MAG: hypothetical protein IJF32_05915 [Oscillospiraceae bacterium]|nr:hypothetical protein [Oscillospiraceae bacterium]
MNNSKSKLSSTLEVLSGPLLMILNTFLIFFPFFVCGLPVSKNIILVICFFLPYISDVARFFVWYKSLFIVLSMPFGFIPVLYYIALAFYVLTSLIPFVFKIVTFIIGIIGAIFFPSN